MFETFAFTQIAKFSPWFVIMISILGFASCILGEKIIDKERRRNRFC
jgi:F0F1-type ATP synthase assembly protein I